MRTNRSDLSNTSSGRAAGRRRAARPNRISPRSPRRTDRGATLLEAMIAAAILVLGLAGALSGIMVASRQNAMASKMSRSSAYASQIRELMQLRGVAWLKGTNGPLKADHCTTDAAVTAYLGKLADTLTSTDCLIDLDAFEQAQTNPSLRLMPGYPDNDETRGLRRLLLHRTFADRDEVTIIVGWNELGLRRIQTQLLVLYNPTVNQTGVEI